MKDWLIALLIVAGSSLRALALVKGGSVAVELGSLGNVRVESPAENPTNITP
jgi:2-keto-4-pentenoate hydratase